MKRISICTVCMNRLVHLKETLPMNIEENKDYPGIEFVVLNYNSGDGLANWIKDNLSKYIEAGILKHYHTTEPEYIHLSHSKNMVLRLATGEILCLVDADNFAGRNYAQWVNSKYEELGDQSIITTLRKDNIPLRDQGGKLGFHRDLLYAVKGFDEALAGYGVDDVDLVNRLEKLGGKRVFIEDRNHLKFIGHSNVERLKNHHLMNNLQQMYILQSPDMETNNTLIYLLKDGTYIELELHFNENIKYNLVLSYAGWSVKNNGYKKGVLVRSKEGFTLTDANGNTRVFRQETPDLVSSKIGNDWMYWRRVTERDDVFYDLIMGFGETTNRTKYLENDRNQAAVNTAGWGRGTVFCNFDYAKPIAVN